MSLPVFGDTLPETVTSRLTTIRGLLDDTIPLPLQHQEFPSDHPPKRCSGLIIFNFSVQIAVGEEILALVIKFVMIFFAPTPSVLV